MPEARGEGYRRFMRGRNEARQQSAQVAVANQPQPGRRQSVLIAVPSESGQINWTIAHQMARAMWNNSQPNCPFLFNTIIKAGMRPIQYVRNLISAEFLAAGFDWLLMVDDDQVMPENFWQLMTVMDADVVSGKTYCWVGNGYVPGRLRVNQYDLIKRPDVEFPECYNIFPDPNEARPYRVPIVGTGCIAIRRHVLEALAPYPFNFSYKENGQIIGGEDINFSQKCNQAGFVIAVNPSVRFGHVKDVDLALVDEYAAARVSFEMAGGKHKPEDVLSIGV